MHYILGSVAILVGLFIVAGPMYSSANVLASPSNTGEKINGAGFFIIGSGFFITGAFLLFFGYTKNEALENDLQKLGKKLNKRIYSERRKR